MKNIILSLFLLLAVPVSATEFSLGTPFQVADSTGWFIPVRVENFPDPTMQGVRLKIVRSGLDITDAGCGTFFPSCASLVTTAGDTVTVAVIEPDPCPALPDTGTLVFLRAQGTGQLFIYRVDLLLDCNGLPLESTPVTDIVPIPPGPTPVYRTTWGRIKKWWR